MGVTHRKLSTSIGNTCFLACAVMLSVFGSGTVAVAEELPVPSERALDDAPGPTQPPPANVEPPRLLERVEAEYPPAAHAARIEGRVILELSISGEGAVTEAHVTDSPGHGFGEAAVEAARHWRFTPAKRNGRAVAARILYAYDFRIATAPVAPTEPLADTPASTPALAPGSKPLTSRSPPTQVVVRGSSVGQRLRESAQAVTVIETEQAQRESADLGELLARTQGIGVQRAGGLGSDSRLSLNGLDDDQIRFFVDGVPVELMGYPFGFENAPVNFVERVDVYLGVVPIRLGADALGGAMELVTDRAVTGTHAAASLQIGSFGTARATLGARHLDAASGWFTSGEVFTDRADNDYYIDVDVPDAQGRLANLRVPRFHDGYSASGVNVETGLVQQKWARRLLLRGFFTEFGKELQHNVLMTVPYGEVRYGGTSAGGSLRYEHSLGDAAQVTAIAGYARNRWDYLDVSECTYDWFGRCAFPRREPGERGAARDQSLWDDTAYARIQTAWRLSPAQTLRVALSPTFFTRTGENRRTPPGARDALGAQRDLWSTVDALEHELDLFDDRLENVVFVKWYRQVLQAEQSLPGNVFESLSRSTSELGFGDALRLRLTPFLYAKASYEWALNLPRPDQIFGNGAQVSDNLELQPERSHNANLSLSLDLPQSAAGAFAAHTNVFLRDVDDLIVLLGSELVFSYQNVFGARMTGVDASGSWISPGEHVEVAGNVTYVDMRNTSSEGTFGDFEGDRIPNRPYLSGNGSLRLRKRDVAAPGDELSVVWYARFVREFFRSWESVGRPDLKATIPSQLTHTAALTYLVEGDPLALSFTSEVQNLTDAEVYDFFGMQRPGRAFYFKTTAEF